MNPFYIVDVFCEKKYQGNQLAVILNAGNLTDIEMQNIAREFNFSETTFILSDEQNKSGFDVRIFTPGKEVNFAGHPTLGTAYIIQNKILNKKTGEVALNLKAGRIPVSFDNDNGLLWMKQINPVFGSIVEKSAAAETLGISNENIDDRFPVQEVSTGLPFIIIPLKNLHAIQNIKPDKEKYFNLISGTEAKIILVFCSETKRPDNQLHVRVFGEYYGVTEDPATGSGNGCLAGYLVKYKYFGKDEINVKSEQGYEIGRPSLLYLKSRAEAGKIEVRVGGRVLAVAEGKLE